VETFQAAGVISRDLEDHYLSRVGLFRNQPGDILLREADLVLAVGYDAVEYDPALWNSGSDRSVTHLDTEAAQIDNHYQPVLVQAPRRHNADAHGINGAIVFL
jgi:acetolactate synthase-1/2/3 large subunit